MKAQFASLLTLAPLAACAAGGSAAPALETASLVGTAWIQGSGGNAPRLQFNTATSVNGTGGCNTFSGKAELGGTAMKLGPLATTKKLCVGPSQAVEDAFYRALQDTASARIESGQLVLLNAKGEEVRVPVLFVRRVAV
ncbi:MAG: META domain-containing protein [Betaproteobacteria bacterium]|nr:META domain-containing protein [Betaproteobacteria bacterium]